MAYIIVLLDENEEQLFSSKVESLPLAENVIIEKSIELLKDPEPCIIHKTYIMKKLFFEIDDFLKKNISKNHLNIPWDTVPDEIKKMIDIKSDILKLQIMV